jgi:hypothetical protein
MDEMMWLRTFGSGFGSSIDLTAVIAFIAFGIVLFLVPVVGYRQENAGGIVASLFLLISFVGISVLQLIFQWVQVLDSKPARGETTLHLILGFALIKMCLFLAAMFSFAFGVRGLRPKRSSSENMD